MPRGPTSPAEVAAASDIVFTMLGYPSEVEEVVLGPGGVLGALGPGSVVVDMTTSRPALAVEIATRAGDAGNPCARRPRLGR